MVLRVIDDGIGFPKTLKLQQGLGYHIMKYRAQLMGGRLEIDSPQDRRHTCVLLFAESRAASRKAKNSDQTGATHAKNSNRTSRQRSNFPTSGSGSGAANA